MGDVVRAGGLQGYETLVRALGADPLPLLQRCGIEPSALAHADGFISLDATLRLMEESAEHTQCPDFGLRLAGMQDSGILGLLSVVIQNAPTVAQAIADTSRYLFLHSPAFEVVLDDVSDLYRDSSVLRFAIRLPVYRQQRQTLDACVGLMYRLSLLLEDGGLKLRGVSLPHAPIAPVSAYRKFFGAPVHFSQPFAGLHADKRSLLAEFRAVNPVLRQLAIEYISRQFPARNLQLSDRVRHTLQRTLGANRGTKGEIAALLAMHPRTLQRHLDAEGASFETLREEVYRSAALRLLHETDIPLKQLAGALGFSEQSALTRACARWFGDSPSSLRRQGADAEHTKPGDCTRLTRAPQ